MWAVMGETASERPSLPVWSKGHATGASATGSAAQGPPDGTSWPCQTGRSRFPPVRRYVRPRMPDPVVCRLQMLCAHMGRYRFLEEIALADCAIDVEGADLGDVFETAARALADVMVDCTTVRTSMRRTIALEAPELDLLLYDWLSELI